MATEPFYGDPTNEAPVFNKYAVLLGSLTATKPTGTPAGAVIATRGFILNDLPTVTTEWDPVGALHEDNPIGAGAESLTTTEHTAAGFGVYATTHKNQKETIEFTALETTLTTLGIIFDASGVTDTAGNLSGTLKQRNPSETFLLGLVRENATAMERYVSQNYAQIESISRTRNNDRGECTVTAIVYPTSAGVLYGYYKGDLS